SASRRCTCSAVRRSRSSDRDRGWGRALPAEPVNDPPGAADRRCGRPRCVLHAWLGAVAASQAQGPAVLRAVAIDDNTCRGALGTDGTRMHLFPAVEHATGIPLGQVRAETKGHEIAAFTTVLD